MNILLVITGGIAAYKSLEFIRLWKTAGHRVTPILTRAAEEFVTPLSIETLAQSSVYRDLFQPGLESGIGHIQLARQCDAILVAPASADFLAKMALGLANDLASTAILAADVPIWVAPAMNPMMWQHPATQTHRAVLEKRGVRILGPVFGEMSCGEVGAGRMVEPDSIVTSLSQAGDLPLAGKRFVVTGGGTKEPIDPVRYIGNHSSGRQAVAIVQSLVHAGANVIFIHGAMSVQLPLNAETIAVETAQQMFDAVMAQSEYDGFIAAAAVADWKAEPLLQKRKKQDNTRGSARWSIELSQNPDILHTVCALPNRPERVVGFAAETETDIDVAIQVAEQKLLRKGCDLLLLNPIHKDNLAFNQAKNHIIMLEKQDNNLVVATDWGADEKTVLADKLTQKLIEYWKVR